MNDNNEKTTTEVTGMLCPVCHRVFYDIHSFADHMNQHSKDEKKKKEEEEKQRKADQKKVDYARLEKLRNMYEEAYNKYYKAKEKYYDDYGESFVEWDDVVSDLFNINRHRWF